VLLKNQFFALPKVVWQQFTGDGGQVYNRQLSNSLRMLLTKHFKITNNTHFNDQFPGQPESVPECQTILVCAAVKDNGGASNDSRKMRKTAVTLPPPVYLYSVFTGDISFLLPN